MKSDLLLQGLAHSAEDTWLTTNTLFTCVMICAMRVYWDKLESGSHSFCNQREGTKNRCDESVAWAPGESREGFAMWGLEAKNVLAFRCWKQPAKQGAVF